MENVDKDFCFPCTTCEKGFGEKKSKTAELLQKKGAKNVFGINLYQMETILKTEIDRKIQKCNI